MAGNMLIAARGTPLTSADGRGAGNASCSLTPGEHLLVCSVSKDTILLVTRQSRYVRLNAHLHIYRVERGRDMRSGLTS